MTEFILFMVTAVLIVAFPVILVDKFKEFFRL